MKLNRSLIFGLLVITVFFMSGCTQQAEQKISEDLRGELPPPEPSAEQQIQPPTQNNPRVDVQPPPKPLRQVTHDGDFTISSGTVTIQDQNLTLHGNLIVNGSGKLIVTDSELHFQQEYNQQYRAYVKDRAKLEMHNVQLRTGGKWFNFQYNNDAKAILDNVYGEDCCIPWHSSSENAQFNITDSTVGLTVNDNVKVHAEGSSLFFELVLSNVQGKYELPADHVERYELVIPKGGLPGIELHITNSTFTDWGTTLDKNTDITFVNSKMTIGLNAGSDWSNPERQSPHVIVSGLKTKTYDDFSVQYDTNKLHLINTFVRDWYPQAFNKAVVEISDSNLADMQSNGGSAKLIVRDSTVLIALARENVTYEFYDSRIKQDVIAHDNAKIYLYNTTVEGQIKEIGNGKVVVQSK